MDYNQLSIIEIVYQIIYENGEAKSAKEAIDEALAKKGIEDPTGMITTQAYMDINVSGLFVYAGDGKWDLKTRQSLDTYDRDGAFYASGEGVSREEEEEAELKSQIPEEYSPDNYDDDNDEDRDDDEYEGDDEEESDDYGREYDENYDETDDDDEGDYLDEEEYNDIMDDYEDMYDDKN